MRFSGAICTCSHLWAAPQSQWFQAISGCLQCFNACFVESWCLPQEMYFVIVFVWFCLRSFRDLDIRHIWKSVERWVFGEAFPRSLHPSLGPWVSSLRAAYWQSSTWSTGSFQSKHFRRVNLRACEVEIPLWNLSCTALETRTGIMIWRSLHDSCWLKSEHSFCNRTAAHQNADVFFKSKTFKCQWFQL